MARIQLEQPKQKDPFDLDNPEVRRQVRELQKELEKIKKDPEKSIHAFEWYCMNKGYFYRKEITKKEFQGRTHLIPVPYKMQGKIWEAWGLRDALKILLAKERFAKSINEPPIQDDFVYS